MTSTTLTVISGVALLAVFALVGWKLRRRRDTGQETRGSGEAHHE